MAKVRVYELARELKIESKLLINSIKKIGIDVSSHQSTLSEEDIIKIKKALKGDLSSTEMPTTMKVKAAKDKTGSIKVIRRRRAVAKFEEIKEEQKEKVDVAEAPSDSGIEEKAQESSQVEVNQELVKKDSSEDKKTPELEIPPQDKSEQIELKEESSVKAEDKAGLKPEPTSVKETKDKKKEPSIPLIKPRSKKKPVLSATIVKKASPEEQEVSRAEQSYRSRTRKEDRHGTRFTGIGTVDEKSRKSDKLPTHPKGLVEERDKNWKKQAKLKSKKHKEDEEEIIKKPVFPKSRRSGSFNTRMLLTQLDDSVDHEIDHSKATFNPKTVYTPSSSNRKRDLKRRTDLKKTQITLARASYRVVYMGETIQVSDFARQLKVKASELIKKLISLGIMATINEHIDFDTATLIARDYQFEVKKNLKTFEDIIGFNQEEYDKAKRVARPPIVTVMGHVDHGKTSILDAIKHTDIASKEAGGITQHIGAYTVNYNDKKITFIDTPGHEAFGEMRARGANVTDIVVLVVAADDGVMPQTIEAINHAKDAGVPLIVAINKIDKPNTNIDRIYTELTEYGIQAEDWGGDTQFIKVSALKQEGIEELIEAILLQSEILELTAPIDTAGSGTVIEANIDVGKGVIATVIIQEGVFKVGNYLVAGTETGKIRAMYDYMGKSIKEAGPSMPVEVIGLDGVPHAGDFVNVVKDDKVASEAAQWRKEEIASKEAEKSKGQSLEDLLEKMKNADKPELSLIVKGDTQGSVEALCASILKLNTDSIANKIIHSAVGGIVESDLSLAQASGAVIIGFNVRSARGLDDEALRLGIPIKYFSVIYDVIDAVQSLMEGKLPPIIEEEIIGHAEVRQAINIPKIGTIAGSAVIDGKIVRTANLRLIRDSIVIYVGKLSSLRRFKDDIKEVKSGYECGIGIENYTDIKKGDIIEAYIIKEIKRSLDDVNNVKAENPNSDSD